MSLLSSNRLYWIKTLSKFVSVQLVVQVLGLASGIFLVRILEQRQYAYYTIATTMQGTMSLLADMGIGAGLSAIGGKVWQDRYRFGELINTALQLRYYLATISILIVTPILLWILIRNGASIGYAILITIAVLVGLNFQLTTGVLSVVPRLHSQLGQVQNIDLVFAVSRLALLGVAYLTILNAAVATAAASLALGIQRFILELWVTESIDKKASLNQEYKTEFIKLIKYSAPNAIYYCLQGQITVLLISLFGSVQSVAEFGALGRLGIIFSVVGSVMNGIVLPSFARCHSPKLLLRRYLHILCTIGLSESVLVGIAVFFPDQLLWILGHQYSHLKSELILIVASAVCFSLVNTMWSLNASKAWIDWVWIEIPSTVFIQIISLVYLDFSTIRGVVIFGLAPLLPGFCVNLYMTYKGLKGASQER